MRTVNQGAGVMKKVFALGGAGSMWLALGWGILVLVGACTVLGLMDIPHWPIWR